MAASYRPTPPLIQTESHVPSSNGDSRSDEGEEDEVISDDEEEQEVDELESDVSEGGESAEEDYRSGEGRRKPGDPLLPAVRVENILNADGKVLFHQLVPWNKLRAICRSYGESRAIERSHVSSASSHSEPERTLLRSKKLKTAIKEEFIKRLTQGGQRQARSASRNNVTYLDMANTTRQYQEFMFLTDMIPLPIPLTEALELRKERSRSMFAEEEIRNPSRPKPPNTSNHDHSEASASQSKSKHRTNGKGQTNGFVHTTVQASAPNGPAHGTPSVLDARPWTHWSEPIAFETTRPTPATATPTNGRASTSPRSRSSESTEKEKDATHHPPGQLAGPASGFIQPRGSGSFSAGNQNTGRTIYSQQP
ncbi:hypothetical protein V5O48_001311 [Marasmius crinis-equi]|uniref:Uncharacterized protein n=1 Tax=Marasmius crinis-equi TaxID=585013 RepID=A0ABR3FZ88_9AGAR